MTAIDPPGESVSRPRRQVLLGQLAGPVRRYLMTASGSAGLLLAAALVALVWANSPWSGAYEDLWATEGTVAIGSLELSMDLAHWVNDGLMALFFFVVGLEVRRELSVGELTDRRRLAVPAAGALLGIVVPALLYLLIAPGGEAARGWGIVIGTDTAFLLGALAIVGPACPTQLRVFLLTLTVFDDAVAVALIGIVYSDSLDTVALVVAGGSLATLAALSRSGEWRTLIYVVVGLVLWVATVESGLHPSIAGMAAGLAIAARAPARSDVEHAASLFRAFRQSPLPEVGLSARRGLARAVSINDRLQMLLHPWTSFVVVPVFALANAGVDLRGGVLGDALASSVTWAVVVGLVLGKLVGIGTGALLAVRLRLGPLPRGVGEGQVLGGAALSGIGFTVSLLIVGLAFDSRELRDEATVGVLLACVLSTLTGALVFRAAAVFRGERTAGLPMTLDTPVDPARDHVVGRPDAPFTLVEYGDFECAFCSRATGVVKDLRGRLGEDLRYVFRHLPLVDVHQHAELLAVAAEAAGRQDRFWDMHDLLFDHESPIEIEDVMRYAGALGLDLARFTEDLEDEDLGAHVRADVESAEASGVRAAPTFFVNGRRHIGPYDAEALARELSASR